MSVLREYVDVGESGAKDSRPQLNELMASARKRQFDAIIVWRFDRFARSTKHLLLAPTTDFPVKKFLPFRLTPRPGAA